MLCYIMVVSQTKEPEKPQVLSPEKTANNNVSTCTHVNDCHNMIMYMLFYMYIYVFLQLVPPLKSRPSLFKGMTILEDTNDGQGCQYSLLLLYIGEGNGIGGEEEYGETKEKSTVNQ